MAQNEITTETARHYLDANGIVRTEATEGMVDTMATAQENVKAQVALCGEDKRPILIDLRALKYQSREISRYYSSSEVVQTTRAIAILVESPVSRVIGNFFLGFNKMRVPTELFTSDTDAITWLKGFLA